MSKNYWNRWPNAEERMARKKVLMERISTYLDTFVDNPQGGWPDATEQDRQEMENIFDEISNLKFARDEDGDSVTRIRVGLRTGPFDLVSFHVPSEPEFDAPTAEILQHIRDFHSAKAIMESKFNNNMVDVFVRELEQRERNKQ